MAITSRSAGLSPHPAPEYKITTGRRVCVCVCASFSSLLTHDDVRTNLLSPDRINDYKRTTVFFFFVFIRI